MNAREEELTARALLADQAQIDVCLQQKRWAELAAVVRFARGGAPPQLAQTDPALYRELREQITRFFLRGGDVLSLEKSENFEPGLKTPFGSRKCAWSSPAYANRHVFARSEKELVCASLAAEPVK